MTMNRSFFQPISLLFVLFALCLQSSISDANPSLKGPASLIPNPPHLAAKAFLLVDADSNKTIAEKNSEQKLPPASLTKMMTLYVISHALKNGQISLDDKVHISKKAWKTGGSKMFVRAGQYVSVRDLIKGIIVDSGNDACVAMAQFLAGNEKNFSHLMNQQAKQLGMNKSHFTDSTGLPNPELYSTAHDLAILGKALVRDFPEYYHWYKQKWFTFNDIKQPNRNRLLWRLPDVDGIKTGHTDEAGYCLVASALKDDTRLISVVLGSPNEDARAQDSQRLLNYGFRFFDTHKIYSQNQKLGKVKVWKGLSSKVDIGVNQPVYITVPKGQADNIKLKLKTASYVEAPIKQGTQLGEVIITLKDKQVQPPIPVYAFQSINKGGFVKQISDGVKMKVSSWFN
jgi:D-alanyl-D-alanine carboxypeptidase (penicillin-binding protein 5/6)